MIKGIGIDIIELDRIKEIVEKKPKIIARVLTQNEIELYNQLPTEKRKIEYFAGRFAAKEACAKAVGTGIGGEVGFKDMEIKRSELGAPILSLHGLESNKLHLSISHSKEYAIAQVIIES